MKCWTSLPISALLVLLIPKTCRSKTMRYRQGALSTTEADDKVIKSWITPVSVAKIREECTRNPECITFSYYSETTRFPTSKVDWAYLYPYADFHVREDEWPSFVEGMEWDGWHTYVNITREKDLVIQEVTTIVERLNSIGMRKNEENKEDTKDSNANETEGGSRLRGGSSSGSRSQKDEEEVEEEDASELDEDDERKLRLLSFLFDIIYRKEHKLIAAPHIIAYMLKLATSSEEIDDVRVNAMKVLIVVADTPETGPILVEHGVYTEMKRMVDEREGWDVISITALDVISNMIIYRSANAMLRHLDAHTFLRKLLSESGFVGLQATLALSHLDDVSLEAPSLPGQNLEALIKLLQSAVEQDVVYDILWDLIPGPLSSVKHIVEGSNDAVRNTLLDAGLMEELLKILEDSGDRKAEDIVCTLEVALMLARTSERARHMVLLAEHTVQEAEERLLKFERAAKLAGGLLEAAATGGRGAEL